MRIAALIYARLDSTRLPGKALTRIGNRALLGHVIDRLKSVSNIGQTIVATSSRNVDDSVAEYANRQGVNVFRGSVNDVLGRSLACAEQYELDAIVRICGDSPFISGPIVDKIIATHLEEKPDITTNVFPRTYPSGVSVEVIDTNALKQIDAVDCSEDDREHVTTYFYNHPERFHIINYASGLVIPSATPLTIDHPNDLVQANWLFNRLAEENSDPGDLGAVLKLAREWRQMSPATGKAAL